MKRGYDNDGPPFRLEPQNRQFKGQKISHAGEGGYAPPPPASTYGPSPLQQLERQIDILHAKLDSAARVAKSSSHPDILESCSMMRDIAYKIDNLPVLNPGGSYGFEQKRYDSYSSRRPGPGDVPNQQPPRFGSHPPDSRRAYPPSHGQAQPPFPKPAKMTAMPPRSAPIPGGPYAPGFAGAPTGVEQMRRCIGTVKSWFMNHSSGFIICRDDACKGQDVYITKRYLREPLLRLRLGDEVEFELVWVKGRPQARDLCLVRNKNIMRVRGKCTKWNPQRKFGFIKSAEYNPDASLFCLATEILEQEDRRLYVGDEVECSVVMSDKGKPQAQDVIVLRAAAYGGSAP